MDSIATKTKKKNKLLTCFRAAASGGSVRTERCKNAPDKPVYPFMAVGERDGPVFPTVRPLASPSDGDDENPGLRRKKGGVGALSRALKAVLFGTSLAKKIRKRKAKQKSNSTNRNSKKENQRHQALSSINNKRIVSDIYHNSSSYSSRTSAPFSSSSFCRSPSSSSDISDGSFLFYPTASRRLFRHRKIYSGWLILLICLLSLALWGKVGAIVCTSAWILCLPRRSIGFKSPKSSDDNGSEAAIDYREHKKRIVIEGLLARDRSAAQNSSLRID